ncbi:MAG: SAM-dependent methyltransferase [Bacteroidales bacterium]|nr:SAM-dependent methyltransferase [Bacteroidales bacterium]
MAGKLILFPVPIGGDDIESVLPAANKALLDSCATFIVEELRTARRFLKRAGYCRAIDDTEFFLLNEHTSDSEVAHYLDAVSRGENVGLLSEAGLPCIADPGRLVTHLAQSRGIEVVPLVGPSSLLLALMGSGLNGQRFAFRGYLPVNASERAKTIRQLEQRVMRDDETQLFIEAPYRNDHMMQSLVETLHPDTLICVACELTMPTQYLRTLSALQWQVQGLPSLNKRNTVFLIGR